jgi:putative ABC transport system permease protein
VFPLLFFLVAALVCLTTMTRMVDDQRIQIGSLKALGYSRFAISMKYLTYGALPALIGAILGLLIGYILFPTMIFTAWQIMYEVPSLTLRQFTGLSASSVIAAVACTTLATLWACISTLREVPAQLMRPKAPAAGKRVFLEYIRPLWKRLGFFQKLTARNLFRYQKRFWMTVIGIGGCTALIIAGFGLRYSLLATMSRQYDELFRYQAQLSVSKDMIEEDRQRIEDFIYNQEGITDVMPCYMNSVTAETSHYQTTAYIQVCDPEDLSRFVDLHVLGTREPLELKDGGVIINQKLSELLGVKAGDSFTVDSGGRSQLTVQGINEHYLAHFIYMTPATYKEAFGKEAEPNIYQLVLENNEEELCSRIFERFMKMEGASGTSRVADIKDTYLGSMERIDFVVIIVILCAAALAIVVLYNLSNINITERQRELATIKVLGFYDGEVSAYIYRENIILTIIGIALGILGGHVLHVWLVHSVEIELMMFGRDTNPMCYVYAAVLTTLFSVIVNVMAHFRMKKINMVESLKSAE